MMLYQNTPIIDETAAVPLGTSQPPTTMTRGRRLSKRMLAMIAGTTMLMGAGGTVWLMLPGGASYTTAAEGLVVATTEGDTHDCLPSEGTFGGVSTTAWNADGHPFKFETCYYSTTKVSTYCWTKSWQYKNADDTDDTIIKPYKWWWYMCAPNDGGGSGWDGSVWLSIDQSSGYHPSIPLWCGPPCQFQHRTLDGHK